MLSFGFRRKKTILITHSCFSCHSAVLYGAKDVSVFQFLELFCQQGGLRGHKEPGGDRTKTADLTWPNRYSIPYDIMWEEGGNPNKTPLKNSGELAA